jgi:hypothetical protein
MAQQAKRDGRTGSDSTDDSIGPPFLNRNIVHLRKRCKIVHGYMQPNAGLDMSSTIAEINMA